MFWNIPPRSSVETEGQALLRLPCPDCWPSPSTARSVGAVSLASQTLSLRITVMPLGASSVSQRGSAHRRGQCAGMAAALFAGGNGDASMAFFAFFFLFFFLVPSDTWSPLTLPDSLSWVWNEVLQARLVAAAEPAPAPFSAFFLSFLFFFLVSFSASTGIWMADS